MVKSHTLLVAQTGPQWALPASNDARCALREEQSALPASCLRGFMHWNVVSQHLQAKVAGIEI